MTGTSQVLTGLAVLACAAAYGTDLFAWLVLRSALSHLDDAGLTRTMGWVHHYADRRMPIPFAIAALTAVLGAATAASAGRAVAAIAGTTAVVALVAWLVTYLRVSAPINRELTAAARAGRIPRDARARQRRWDDALPLRFGLQLVAMTGLGLALTLPYEGPSRHGRPTRAVPG